MSLRQSVAPSQAKKKSPTGAKARAIAATEPVSPKKKPGQDDKAARAGACRCDSGHTGKDVSRRRVRSEPSQRLGVDGRDDSLCPVHRRAGEPGDSCAVQGLPYSQGDGRRIASRVGGVDPHDGLLSQQGQVDQGCGQSGGRGVRRQGSADDGRAASAARRRPQDRQRSPRVMV